MILTAFGGRAARLAAVFAAFALSACAYNSSARVGQGSGIDNPVERKFTWLSYLDAAEIRISTGLSIMANITITSGPMR